MPVTKKNNKKQILKLYQDLQDRKFLSRYEYAIESVKNIIIKIEDQLILEKGRDVMEFHCARVKSPESIARKLHKKGCPLSAKKAMEQLNDIAGLRIVCDYTDDIYAIRKALLQETDLFLVKEKDFIKDPKKSGYRSLHLILDVPVTLNKKTDLVRVEIQLRTVIMDFWARLDHQTRYKHNGEDLEEIFQDLSECAKIGEQMDRKMLKTRIIIEETASTYSV